MTMAKLLIRPIVLSITLLFAVIGLYFAFSTFTIATNHDEGDEVTGYAWSDNIGWISLNCNQPEWPGTDERNTCSDEGGIDYAVRIDFNRGTIGEFNGYAWSSNIGWISFNRSDTGNPPQDDPGNGSGRIAELASNPNCADSEIGVNGWARALSHGDGWDGWIKMSGVAGDGDTYEVCLSEDEQHLDGFAWGDEVVGWVYFDPNFNLINREGIKEITPE